MKSKRTVIIASVFALICMLIMSSLVPAFAAAATQDSAAQSVSASADQTLDSAKNYDGTNNANGSIATNEDNKTMQLFILVIAIVAAVGVVYFIIQFKNRK